MTSAPVSPLCSPTWATPRDPDAATIGAQVEATARLLGTPLIPWQRMVADVAGELTARGRFRYRRVVLVVPRRAGKTALALAYALTVSRRRPAARTSYASHRRESAAGVWRDEWIPAVEGAGLAPRFVACRRANGSESFTWRHNRATFRLLPPNPDALRSLAADLAVLDEARMFTPELGRDFEASAFPTMATRDAQVWIVSSAGGEWFRTWVDRGRAATTDPRSRIAHFEWAAPDGADPADPATWWAAHPGLGYHVLPDALADDCEVMSPDVFGAEYLGRWPSEAIDTELLDAWQAAGDPAAAPADPVTFAVELDPERTRVQVIAVGTHRGRLAVELVLDRPHGPWVAGELTRLAAAHHPYAICWDAGGPVAALGNDLADVPANMHSLAGREMAAAAGAFHDAVLAGRITHRDDDTLTAGIVAARRRTVGGAWLYDRRQPGSGPLIAATIATWVHRVRTRGVPTVS